MLYEENLWGRVNELHLRYKRQNQNLENLIYMFTQFQNVLYYYGRDLTKAVDKNYNENGYNKYGYDKYMFDKEGYNNLGFN